MLEFNNEHVKANFKKLIDKITLEYNNNHTKANLKNVEIKLKKVLLVVSGVGLITVATGCSLNKDYTVENKTYDNATQIELFSENEEVLSGALKVDNYEQSEVILNVLEKAGVEEMAAPENIEEISYEEFETIVEEATETLNNEYKILFTDQDLTEAEKQLVGDYYALKEYMIQNQNNDYQELYNNVLQAKMQEAFLETGIKEVSIVNIKSDGGFAYLTLRVDNEQIDITVDRNSSLAQFIANVEKEDYDNFCNEINRLMNDDMREVKGKLSEEKMPMGVAIGFGAGAVALLSPMLVLAIDQAFNTGIILPKSILK